jgi:predicted glycogen debranching enzyme
MRSRFRARFRASVQCARFRNGYAGRGSGIGETMMMETTETVVAFGPDVCGDLARASAREWLVTSGNGAFASGTIDGAPTRRYHGLLFAALDGPAERTLLFVKVDEIASSGGTSFALSTNRWHGGGVEPRGYRFIERFFLDGTTPVWQYAFGDALLEKRITMEADANAVAIRYTLLRGSAPLELAVKAIVDHRDFHGSTHADTGAGLRVEDVDGALCVRAPDGATGDLWVRADRGTHVVANEWYRGYDLSAERERGLDDTEDHVHAGTFTFELAPGEAASLRAATDAMPAFLAADGAFPRRAARDAAHLRYWHEAEPERAARAPAAIRQLILAADQFVVERAFDDLPEGHSIVAGYPWFGDWGRDAMIALPGLLLATGRRDVALTVLRTFGRLIDGGMLPNTIPNRGRPSYNTVDAALWFVEAVRAYVATTANVGVLDELFPMISSIVEAYAAGTRYGIRVDPADGLVTAGEPGVQLTWMDAIVDGRVITPRMGKPVEINALWYNALRTLAALAPHVGVDVAPHHERAERVRTSFARYSGDTSVSNVAGVTRGGLLDVLDGPDGNDASLRPNQIFAASLFYSPLDVERQRAVVRTCADHLLTPYGLRSLAPSDPHYVGRYGGSPASRDAAYHQGTVWGYLIGPFAIAHARAFGDRAAALAYVQPLLDHLDTYGLGTLGELFDGDPPFAPKGAIAQAWTVAEVLRAWHELA